MAKITIPANQFCKEGELMQIHIESRVCAFDVYLKAKARTSSASYDESWLTSEFNRKIHGFSGINDDLEALVHLIEL